jgi:hypothetical protein
MNVRAAATALVYVTASSETCGCDVAFPGDARLIVAQKGAVYLRKPKSGRPQFVQLRDPLAIRILRRLFEDQKSVVDKHSIVGIHEEPSFSSCFQADADPRGVQRALFVIHSHCDP